MNIKKTLASLVLGGALAFGGLAGKAKATTYFEDFSNPNALENWVASATPGISIENLNGDNALKFNIPNKGYAYVPVEFDKLKPFSLEWDSKITSNHGYLMLGVMDENLNYALEEAIASFHAPNNQQGLTSFWYPTTVYDDYLNRWYHNVLTSDSKNIKIEMYRKGEVSPRVSLTHTYDTFPQQSVTYDRFGLFSYNLQSGDIAYIDNISFTGIPEPSTSVLGLAGLASARALATRKKK